MTDRTLAVRNSGVIHERLDGETLVIDLDHGVYYGIGGAGTDVWTSFARPATVDGVANDLALRYGAPVDEVRVDVLRFVSRLEAAGLLVRVGTADGAGDAEPPELGGHPRGRWVAPVLEVHDEMANLVLREPTLLLDEHGWPHLPDPAP